MATAISIDTSGIYDDDSLSDVLGLGAQTLVRARRSGELRHVRKGQRILYLGSWVLDWLKTDASPACPKEVARVR
jgi:hypothetical protein